MNEVYATPKSQLEDDNTPIEKPSRLFVDLSFWTAHLGIIISIVTAPAVGDGNEEAVVSLLMMIVGVVGFFVYFFAIGIYASKLGRSGVAWGGLSFLFSPLSVWITYIASFTVGPKK